MVKEIVDSFRHLFGAGDVTAREWSVLILAVLAWICLSAIVVVGVLYCRAVLRADQSLQATRPPDVDT